MLKKRNFYVIIYNRGGSMDGITLTIVTMIIVAIVLIVVVLNLLQSSKNKRMKTLINNLEVQKNILDSTPITC